MKTESLIKALKVCRGAVESAGIYPIFSHYCFADDFVYGFNDVCAIVVPFPSGISAGLRGDVLLPLLGTMGEEVTLTEQKNDSILLVSGKSKVELAALPEEAFMFQPPEEEWTFEAEAQSGFFAGLSRCTSTLGDDAQNREFTGVTVLYDGKVLTLYSSDDVRLSKFSAVGTITTKSKKPGKWLIPGRACTLLLDCWQNAKEDGGETPSTLTLQFSNDWLRLSSDNFDFYSKLMPETPPDYLAVIKKVAPKETIWQPVPVSFTAALRRAEILVGKDSAAAVQLDMEKKTLRLELVKGRGLRYGELEETVTLMTPVPELSLMAGIVKLVASVDSVEEVSFNETCIGLRTRDELYTCWVSPMGSAEE